MYPIKELPEHIAARVTITLGPEELVRIDNDDILRAVVVDAAGRESAVLLQQIQGKHEDYLDLLGGQVEQSDISFIYNTIVQKAISDVTIDESVAILKKQQKILRQQVESRDSINSK